jgi:hypothetical protein
MCLKLQAFVASPLQPVNERAQVGHHRIRWGLFKQAYREKHSGWQGLFRRCVRNPDS